MLTGIWLSNQRCPLISDAVRNFSRVDPNDTAPYGRSWDVLWLGHWGEITETGTVRFEFNDTTLGRPAPWDRYVGWSKFKIGNVKEGHRLTQMARLPVCSFGYALNRENAQKVLTWAGRSAYEAFDVVLSLGRREGHLQCITINPEIMHHYNPAVPNGYVSHVGALDGKGNESKEKDIEKLKGNTVNIVHSARCEALCHDTGVQPP